MKESKIQKKIIDHIIKDGGDACKITAPSRRGVPDILALINGDIYLFEVKVDEKSKRSVLQEAFIKKWGADGKAYFVDGFYGFLGIYDTIYPLSPKQKTEPQRVDKPIAKWFREKKGQK